MNTTRDCGVRSDILHSYLPSTCIFCALNMLSPNMQHLECEPPAELRDTIQCFWYTRRDFGELPSVFEILPDGYTEITFHYGSACSIACNGGLRPLPSPFLMGLLEQPVLLYATNRLEVLGIRCFPWTVFDVLGVPPGTEGMRLCGHPLARLQPSLERCIRAGRIDEALAEVTQYFLHTRSRISTDSMVFRAGVAMREAYGTLPVHQVAAAAHTTVRTLERKFRQSSGHTVKEVSGLIRFEQARNHLWLHPHANLAGLAHELGYTDQSHLSREFRRYSGTTPAAFARRAP